MNGVRLLDAVSLFSFPVLFLIFSMGLLITAPPDRIRRLYSFRIKLLSAFPFSAGWMQELAPEHQDAFRKSRTWFLVGFTAILVVGLLNFIYLEFFFLRLHGFDTNYAKNRSLHTEYTHLRPRNDADQARAATLVSDIQHALAKYRDYHVAEAEGFKPPIPEFNEPNMEFFKRWPGLKDASAFDASKPYSLLYLRTPDGGYKLTSATYTDDNAAPEDQLNARIPLSVARWQRDVNLCLPARGADTKTVDWTKFGFDGSIATKQACDAVGGRFRPLISGWMIEVHPWEQDPKLVWAQ